MKTTYTDFDSSNVAELTYDPDTREVEVQFKDKAGNHTGRWCYFPVAQADFDAIHTADSIGSAVNKHLVRGGVYNSKRVDVR